MSGLDHRLEPEGTVRRFEVIDGAAGRRRWSADARTRILEETLVPGAVVSVVARRHGLTPQQLFTWRREARQAAAALPTFVPAVIAPEPVVGAEPARAKPPRRRAKRAPSRRRAAGIPGRAAVDCHRWAAEMFADTGPRWCAYMASKALLIGPARRAFEAEMPGMDSRLRTNIATLLGAGFVAVNGRVPTTNEVIAEVAEFAETTAEHAEEVSRDDALEALLHLLAYPIGGATLGQWIARERRDRMENGEKDNRPSAVMLASCDIAMDVYGNNPGFFLLRGAPGINKIFERTKWEGAWVYAIRKYAGAFSPQNPIYFTNIKKKARAIGIGFDILPEPTEVPNEPVGERPPPKGTPDF